MHVRPIACTNQRVCFVDARGHRLLANDMQSSLRGQHAMPWMQATRGANRGNISFRLPEHFAIARKGRHAESLGCCARTLLNLVANGGDAQTWRCGNGLEVPLTNSTAADNDDSEIAFRSEIAGHGLRLLCSLVTSSGARADRKRTRLNSSHIPLSRM